MTGIKSSNSLGHNLVEAIVESPQGCRNKYKHDEARNVFTLKKSLPLGAEFPYDFGFVPGTKAQDGDPIDIMILMDAPTFTGCYVTCRVIGAIKAEQTKSKTVRNDRIIAVFDLSSTYGHITELEQLSPAIIRQIEHFFISYNQAEGKRFIPIGRAGTAEAMKLIEDAWVQ
ncbi:MAG: inorganic diphosphatase [Sphingobacteriales bacterium]|nr:MAG: inorganic diphosphatase [Sphingobacteriales bacterium]